MIEFKLKRRDNCLVCGAKLSPAVGSGTPLTERAYVESVSPGTTQEPLANSPELPREVAASVALTQEADAEGWGSKREVAIANYDKLAGENIELREANEKLVEALLKIARRCPIIESEEFETCNCNESEIVWRSTGRRRDIARTALAAPPEAASTGGEKGE